MAAQGKQAPHIELLFLKYAEDLRRFLGRYIRNTADIEDCAQEAFLNLWQRGAEIAPRRNARAYLFTTALNVMYDNYRRDQSRQRENHVELSETGEILRSREQEEDFYWKESLRRIEAELKNLKPSTRRVFLMHHVEHLTFTEIAKRLEISTRTVEREMVRALDHLKDTIGSIFENAKD